MSQLLYNKRCISEATLDEMAGDGSDWPQKADKKWLTNNCVFFIFSIL